MNAKNIVLSALKIILSVLALPVLILMIFLIWSLEVAAEQPETIEEIEINAELAFKKSNVI